MYLGQRRRTESCHDKFIAHHGCLPLVVCGFDTSSLWQPSSHLSSPVEKKNARSMNLAISVELYLLPGRDLQSHGHERCRYSNNGSR
jgi:hypothetical protein